MSRRSGSNNTRGSTEHLRNVIQSASTNNRPMNIRAEDIEQSPTQSTSSSSQSTERSSSSSSGVSIASISTIESEQSSENDESIDQPEKPSQSGSNKTPIKKRVPPTPSSPSLFDRSFYSNLLKESPARKPLPARASADVINSIRNTLHDINASHNINSTTPLSKPNTHISKKGAANLKHSPQLPSKSNLKPMLQKKQQSYSHVHSEESGSSDDDSDDSYENSRVLGTPNFHRKSDDEVSTEESEEDEEVDYQDNIPPTPTQLKPFGTAIKKSASQPQPKTTSNIQSTPPTPTPSLINGRPKKVVAPLPLPKRREPPPKTPTTPTRKNNPQLQASPKVAEEFSKFIKPTETLRNQQNLFKKPAASSSSSKSATQKITPIKKVSKTPSTPTTPTTPGGTKIKRRKKRITAEIRKFKFSTHFLIPKLPFARVVREIVQKYDKTLKLSALALEALQIMTETHAALLMEDSNISASHTRRVTIGVKDIRLRNRVRILL
ncbi:hypothetical protein RB653_004336 [Dictyostelium firmibasis]|uniref:Core Histone H2A/H2B/H3 domain-containing protein n=1 Tax=Dictyostelium firmibasis TaxID=79012 RepID=A0AAN7UAB7_9MYCE